MSPSRLRDSLALITVAAGAAGSVGLLLKLGQRTPRFLLLLFIIWVLSPFLALAVAGNLSKRWSVVTRTTLHGVMLIVTLGSLAIYGNVAFGTPRTRPAAMFLLVPLGSWLLLTISVASAAFVSARRSRRIDDQSR